MKIDDKSKHIKFVAITLLSLCNFKFKSFRRFLIYACHYSGYINLREVNSIEQITNERLISIIEPFIQYKITKIELYKITKCSKNTFNKRLDNYFAENKLNGRRKFTLLETYGILNEWQGKGSWGSMESIKKERLAKIISSGDYRKIAREFERKFGKEYYKNSDKFSPNEVKKLLEHIDMLESEEAKELLGEIDSGKISIWIFAVILAIQIWERNKHEFRK